MSLKPGVMALVAEDEPLLRMEAADVLGGSRSTPDRPIDPVTSTSWGFSAP